MSVQKVFGAQAPGVKKYSQKSDVLSRMQSKPTLLVLFFIAIGLRLFFLKFRFAISFDEVNYLKLGVSGHLNGISDILHTYWSPLLPWLISFSCTFFSDYELAGRLVSVIAGSLLIFPVFGLAKEVFDRKTAVVAATFIALFPPLAFQSTLILTEPVMMFLGAYVCYFGLKSLKLYSIGYAIAATVVAALAYLAHPLALGFELTLIAWFIFGALFKWFLITKLRLFYLLSVCGIVFFTVASPYLFFLKNETGKWTFSAKGAANQQMATPAQGAESSFRALDENNEFAPIDQVFHQGTFLNQNAPRKAGREVRFKPFVVKMVKNFANVLQKGIPPVLTTIPLMLMGVGLFGISWPVQKTSSILYILSYLFVFWLILIPAFHINLRYLTPMWPICAIFIGRGFVVCYDWLRQYMPIAKLTWKKKTSASSIAAFILLAVFILFSVAPEFVRVAARDKKSVEYVADPIGQKQAGYWLRQNYVGEPVIMSRNHAVDYYAGVFDIKKSVTVPINSLERTFVYAKNRGVTHLVLNERYLPDYPELGLLLGDYHSPHLRQVYKRADESGLATVIYELHDVQ